jgi:hypothetical protein
VGRSGGTAGSAPIVVDPGGDLRRVEADEMAPLDEGDAPFGHEPPDVSGVDAEMLGEAGDVEEPGRELAVVVFHAPLRPRSGRKISRGSRNFA